MGALMRLIRLARKSARAALLASFLVMGFYLPIWGAGTCDNFVNNGGFEDGTQLWNQSANDQDFLPICTSSLEVCSTAFPSTGSNWAWFGGMWDPFPLEASLEQSITIPVVSDGGIIPLRFYLLIPRNDADIYSNDLLRVTLDGNPLFSTKADNTMYLGELESEYVPVTIDISDYANGGSHTLRFESIIDSTTSFLVDDISRPDLKFVNTSKNVNFADDLLQQIIDKTLLAQEIRGQDFDSRENILINQDNSSDTVTLKGGYGCDFAGTPAINSTTSIQSLEVQRGTVTVENISVVSPASMTGLVIKSGGKVIARNMVVKISP